MNGLPVLFVTAKKKISSGDEVTYDYGPDVTLWNTSIPACLCGSNNCRHPANIDNVEANDTTEEKAVEEAVDDIFGVNDDAGAVVVKPDEFSYAGIENNSEKRNGICFFSASIQFLFRGISKKYFKDKVDNLGNFKIEDKKVSAEKKILLVVKTMFFEDMSTVLYNPHLHNLAIGTQDDPTAVERDDQRDTTEEHQNHYDADFTLGKLIDYYFSNCILFRASIGIMEEEQQNAVYEPMKRVTKENTSDSEEPTEQSGKGKKRQKKKQGSQKKGRKKQKIETAPTTRCPKSKVFDYDLPSLLGEYKNTTQLQYYSRSASDASPKYFIVSVSCFSEVRMEKRLNNVIALELVEGAEEICGYAILKTFILLQEHHFTTYVHDRYVHLGLFVLICENVIYGSKYSFHFFYSLIKGIPINGTCSTTMNILEMPLKGRGWHNMRVCCCMNIVRKRNTIHF